MRTKLLLGFAVSATLSACGSAEPTGDDPTGQVAQEISFKEQCDTIAPNVTLTKNGPVIGFTPYDHGGCRKAFLIDLKNYQRVSPTQQPGVTMVWAGGIPTTAATCQLATSLFYAWETTSGVPVAIGATSATGVWTTTQANPTPHCEAPVISILTAPLLPIAGHSYRYAVSARQSAPNGSYVTESLAVRVD